MMLGSLKHIHTAEPLESEHISFEVEITIEKSKNYKSPDIDQIPTQLIQAEVKHYIVRSTNLLILSLIRNNFPSSGRNLLLCLFVKKGDKTD
jgi:hypothetical protein